MRKRRKSLHSTYSIASLTIAIITMQMFPHERHCCGEMGNKRVSLYHGSGGRETVGNEERSPIFRTLLFDLFAVREERIRALIT